MELTHCEEVIQECTWRTARPAFAATEPELTKIIDNLSPDKKFPLFKTLYPFGGKIYDGGVFHLPIHGKRTLPINEHPAASALKEQLNYSPLPLGLQTDKGVEIYCEMQDRVFSLAYFTGGLRLGVWEIFAPPPPFTMCAGARSLYLVPKVTNSDSHLRLRRFGVRHSIPQNLAGQWNIFKKAAQHPNFYTSWVCPIFFFSAPWVAKIKHDSAWSEFRNFVHQRAWEHTSYGRNKAMIFDTAWHIFPRLLANRRIKPTPYILDTFKHLIFAANGALPAFTPATDNHAGPIDGLMKMYLEDYRLETYVPTIMQPYHFSLEKPERCAYYSLQVPTYLESTPFYRTSWSGTLPDLIELSELVQHFKSGLAAKPTELSAQHLYELFRQIRFDYFHSKISAENEIRFNTEMALEDPYLLYMPEPEKHGSREFGGRGNFVQGCIRMSVKSKNVRIQV